MSELEDNKRNFFRMQKNCSKHKKVARNTRSCQKVAEQHQQQLYLHDYNYVIRVLQKL